MKSTFFFLLFISGCHQQTAKKSNDDIKISVNHKRDSNWSKGMVLSIIGQKIIHLPAGLQPGIVATGKSNITYFADHGLVIFTSPIKLGNTLHIKFDGPSGFKFIGKDYSVFKTGDGNNVGDTIRNFDFGNTANTAFDAITKIYDSKGNMLTYDGTPKTSVFWGLTVDSFQISGKTCLYQGPWEANNTYHMVTIGPTFLHGKFLNDGTGDNQKIRGNSIYGLQVRDWKVIGPTTSNGGDYGIITIVGSGKVENIYRDGGWGYLERIVIVQLNGIPFDQTCSLSNCIDVNSTQYGTLDVRIEPEWLKMTGKIALNGADFYFSNNISGNKTDFGGYVTNAVVAGNMKDDHGKIWTLHLFNNLAFNAMPSAMSNASSLIKNNSNGLMILDSANNMDLPPGVPIPSGLLDKNFIPVKGSFLEKMKIGVDNGTIF
jgi:hypothetical protein